MNDKKIRVGIIGSGGWTQYSHIPVLKNLSNFELIAISTRKKADGDALAAKFDIPYSFTDSLELINHPEVDMVAILIPAPLHADLVKAAIKAGKDVYSEWPLTTKTCDSEELLALAEAKGIKHIVGLQRKMGPSSRYTRDLIKQGFIGQIRSARMFVSVDAFPATMPGKYEWTFKDSSFTNSLTVYAGHFMSVLCQSVGFPKKLNAVVANQFPFLTVMETGEKIPRNFPDQAVIQGILENGALFTVQIEGGQKHRTGLQIDITGTEGVLRISNRVAFENKTDNLIEGMNGNDSEFRILKVPDEYKTLRDSTFDASVEDLAYLYEAYARDKKNGTSEASNFRDALKQHQIIDLIEESSKNFFLIED